MELFHIILVSFLLQVVSVASDNNTGTQNKTKVKRTLSDQIYSNGESKAVIFYMESPPASDASELQASASSQSIRNFYSAPSKPLALVSVQQPIQVFEQGSPKQVAEQQVLYEFQQTPTNAESNVHVKQLFQPNVDFTTRPPLNPHQQIETLPTNQAHSSIPPTTSTVGTLNHQFHSSQPQAYGLTSASNYHPSTSESIVSPGQHNSYTNHGLNSAPFNSYNPPLPQSQQFQSTQITPKQVPGKYIYLNGRIVYHPSNIVQQGQTFPSNSLYNRGIYHNQQKLPLLNYGMKHNRPIQQNRPAHPVGRTTNNVMQSVNLPPITRNRFQAPTQVLPVDTPSTFPHHNSEEADEEDEKQVDENSESTEEVEENEKF